MNRAVREASGGQRYRSPPLTSHLEPAAYLARWPVIFEGSVTGLAATKSPRVPASRDSLCINDELYRFLSRAADRDGREPEGRVEKSKNLLTELACNEWISSCSADTRRSCGTMRNLNDDRTFRRGYIDLPGMLKVSKGEFWNIW